MFFILVFVLTGGLKKEPANSIVSALSHSTSAGSVWIYLFLCQHILCKAVGLRSIPILQIMTEQAHAVMLMFMPGLYSDH